MDVNQISQTGRVAQGVRLINLKDENLVSNVTLVKKEETEDVLEGMDQQTEEVNEN